MSPQLTIELTWPHRPPAGSAQAVLLSRRRWSVPPGSPVGSLLATTSHRLRQVMPPRTVAHLALGALFLTALALGVGLISVIGHTTTQPAKAPDQSISAPAAPAPVPAPVAPSPIPAPGPPGALAGARPGLQPEVAPGGSATHQVSGGETLAAIALRYQVPVPDMAAANGIANPHRITTGESLAIPPPSPGVLVIQPGTTLTHYAQVTGLSTTQLLRLNPHITNPNRIYAGGRLDIGPVPR